MTVLDAPVLEARSVSRVLEEGPLAVTLVRDIDLTIERGAFITITGPSGSGKSSLLYLLGLLDRPTEGTILLDGEDTSALDSDTLSRLRLEKIGFVFQFHFLLPEFTALENVLLPVRKLGRMGETEADKHAKTIFERLDLTSEMAKRPGQLSGGQRQRVAIARALANDPLVILADEPTGNLDTKNARNVFDIFERLTRDSGKTVIAVTHEPELAARAGRRIHIVDGRIANQA